MRATLVGLVLVGLLTGCDGSSPTTMPTTMPTNRPTTSARSPAPTGTSPAGAATAVPADFPLAQGLVDGDETQVTGPAPDASAIELDSVCGLRGWSDRAIDRLAVQQVGPESAVTRELVLFENAAVARATVGRIRNTISRCAEPDPDQARVVGLDDLAGPAGYDATGFAQLLAGGRPGGAVFAFVRVGAAVLGVEDGGEWTIDSIGHGLRLLVHRNRHLAGAMRVFRP